MDENKTSVDILWEEITSIQKILGEAKEGSSLNDYNKTIRKVLLLSCASFFEVEMTEMLKRYVRNVSNNDEKLVNFLEKQAINMRYHTLINSWGEKNNPNSPAKNINSFLSLFGEDFKTKVTSYIKEDNNFDISKNAFLEIGHIRNILVHNDFASYLYENKTPRDIFDLYTKAKYFIPKIEELLNMKEDANPTTNN
ncbi:HEPN domain-containing protein [uncultured Capnocytophaga sp.]|uniref:HEPN domain-containing protein n=1 Tax=uncultured Capnocytophaga sp. TaxID=159273 RepID=UPI00260E95FF|nr:HEPN domain-containing protein [uncultured Capnocytophaga sp.]